MILKKHKIIFVHIRKTGGNFIQEVLLPHSEDQKVIKKSHQDSIERFSIEGEYTLKKHATVEDYYNIMGEELFLQYELLTVYRDPVERMISAFYSPARNIRKVEEVKDLTGSYPVNKNYVYVTPEFDLGKFEKVVARQPSIVDMLRLGEKTLKPHYLIRFDRLVADLSRIMKLKKLDGWEKLIQKRKVNVSFYHPEKQLYKNSDVVNIVMKYHGEDYRLLQNL